MIVYPLGCAQGHFFEGWFPSAERCDEQAAAGQLRCPTCASADVRKMPSAPHVHTSASAAATDVASAAVRQEVLLALRKFVAANTEDVGRRFPEVARRMHYKEEEARGIRGRVTTEEAAELHDEGIEAFVLPPEIAPSEEEIH